MNLLLYTWLLLKASLFSTGGLGNVPSLHSDLIARGWATDPQFAEALSVGQVSPGPNGLWVISLGYLMAGLRGALLALLAIIVPPLLVIAVDRLYRRIAHHPAVEGFVRGLSLAVVGIFVVVLFRLLHSAGMDIRSLAIAVSALGLGATKRVPPLVVLALSASVGLVLFRLPAAP